MLVPAPTPVTNPELLTTTVPILALTHGSMVAAVAEPINCILDSLQTDRLPEIVGSAFTVTAAVVAHPTELV